MGRIVEGFWNCAYCGTTPIRGGIRECPNCGKARDEDTVFSLNPKKISYVPNEVAVNINRNPDWLCTHCKQLNSDSEQVCKSCAAPRTKENLNYFENRKEKEKEKLEESKKYNYSDKTADISDNSEEEVFEMLSSYDSSNKTSVFDIFKDKVKNLFKNPTVLYNILIALVCIIAIAGLIYLLIPKEHDLTVQELSWTRSIDIQRYQTVEESDWYLPSGGRLLYTREEFSHYQQVLDHYETRTREVAKERLVGYEEHVTGYRDLGNGYFEEITSTYPVYETYYETETYQEPVYRDEPVYRTKYYYEIDKWLYERSVRTQGADKNPYWGEVSLADDERVSAEIESYYIIGIDEDGKEQRISLSYEDWISLEIGQTATFKISMGHGQIITE